MKNSLAILTFALIGCAPAQESRVSFTEQVQPVAIAGDSLECDSPATRDSLAKLQEAQRNYNTWAVLPPEQRKGIGKYATLLAAQSAHNDALGVCKSNASGP